MTGLYTGVYVLKNENISPYLRNSKTSKRQGVEDTTIMDGDVYNHKHSDDVSVTTFTTALSTRAEYNRTSSRERYISSSRDKQNADIKINWYNLLEEFTEGTSLHGLKYIVNRNAFVLRRLLWFCLTLSCSTLLVFQIIDRVEYFYSSPITVNFKVNYNQSLRFPAITICNQNTFRATAARTLGWYRLVEHMDKHGKLSGNQSWADVVGSDLPLDRLFVELGHKKEDFIVRCEWAGEICTLDDFTTSLTDHGLCYTFNKESGRREILDVSSSGQEHGLRLTLNAEQYEAMPGPHDATGIKILTTNQSEFPRVDEVGIAISTGSQAFVGLSVLVINNLPKPHGDCGDRPLYSSVKYTPEVCTLECITKYIKKQCGCRHFYMPNINGNLSVCTVRQYFECYKKEQEFIRQRTVEMCDCPTSCNYMIYDSTISYATMSKHIKGHLLEASKSQSLKSRFYEARETTHRMNEAILQTFERMVLLTSKSFGTLKDLLVFDIQERLGSQLNRLMEVGEDMKLSIRKKRTIYRYQQYVIQKNFMRARDAMEERTLSIMCLGFHEHVFDTEFLLREMHDAKSRNASEVEMLYIMLKKALSSKTETAKRAYVNYTQLYSAYENGKGIFNYKYYSHPRTDNAFVVPMALLNESLSHNKYARKHSPRVGEDILRVFNSTILFKIFVDEAYDSLPDAFDDLRMNALSQEFINACQDFFHSKSTFYFEAVDRPLRIIQGRLLDFENLKQEYEHSFSSLKSVLNSLKDSLKDIRERFLTNLTDQIFLARQYFNESEAENVTKLELANMFTSTSVRDNLHSIVLFFNDLRQRGQYIYEKWFELKTWCTRIWLTILTDEDSFSYYSHKNLTSFLRNFTNVSNEMNIMFTQISDDNDLRYIIGNIDNAFELAILTLINDLRTFLDGNRMGDDFIRENFLQLDIFYKEIRHEQIDQQVAYDAIAFLCDIGGSLGLFIGASVMTVFEVLDFAINQTALYILRERNRKKKKRKKHRTSPC